MGKEIGRIGEIKMANRKSKRSTWHKGAIFLIPLADQTCGVGQVLTNEVMGLPTIALFDYRVSCDSLIEDVPSLGVEHCISVITILGYLLEDKEWPMIGEAAPALNSSAGENWKYGSKQWIGSKHYSDDVACALLNAYYGLEAWDDFADPEFLDKLLLPPRRRPERVRLIKSN